MDPYAEAEPLTIEITLDPRTGIELQEAAADVGLTPAEWAQASAENGVRLFKVLGAQLAAQRIEEAKDRRGVPA